MTSTAINALDTLVEGYEGSPQYRDGKFVNAVPVNERAWAKLPTIMWRYLVDKHPEATPKSEVPVQAMTLEQLLAAPDNSLFRLGHSTILIKTHGQFWLTDPVFAERASPFSWMGPKRFHQPPLAIDELPPLKGIIISHNHYDHLDKAAMLALADNVEQIYTPLGVGDTLMNWGVAADKVTQLDWWQEILVDGVTLAATPSQHFSGRGLRDTDKSLWASWVLHSDDMRLFFSGDSGYFDGFKAIGDKYGPFDITLVETGAYDKDWADVHMHPAESLQAHLDLRGKYLFPIHNGTFDLALHAWYDPFEQILALADEQGVSLVTPEMGEAVDIKAPAATRPWWRLAQR